MLNLSPLSHHPLSSALTDNSNARPGGSTKRPGETAAAKETREQQAELTLQQQRQLQSLKQRDREVRAHEAAHLAAAGNLARGGATFAYQRGPDGARYAVGGEVSIDTSAVAGDPRATLQKAQTIQRAALAPAQPSGQDRAIAARATAMAIAARAELAQTAAESYRAGSAESGEEAPPRSVDLYA